MDIFNSWLVEKYIAHRGLHDKKAPENSLKAFENAIKKGYAIELDVHLIEDGNLIVFHDDTLTRLTGKDGYTNKIKNIEELKKYNLDKTEEKIPTLQEVFDLVKGQVPILIEVKDSKTQTFNPTDPLCSKLYKMIKEYDGETAVMSFNPYILKWFKIQAPEIFRGQLASYFKGENLKFIVKFILKRMLLNKKVSQPDFIAYKYDEVPNHYVNKFKKLPLLVWAVPNQKEYIKVAPHCDNIIFENFEPKI